MVMKSGEAFDMITFGVDQVRLNGDAVKALLTDLRAKDLITAEQLEGVFKTISFEQMKIVRKDKALKKPFVMPNLTNATVTGLVDMLGSIREDIALEKKLEGIYRTAIMARLVEAGEANPSEAPEEDEDERRY